MAKEQCFDALWKWLWISFAYELIIYSSHCDY